MAADTTRDPMTLTRYILDEQQKHVGAAGDLSIILASIATSCKSISSAVRRAGLLGLYGLEGTSNATGDAVKKLDVISDEIMVNSLSHTRRVALLVSEERDEPIVVPGAHAAKYICSFDPLDGSSNIDCNVSVGTIFGISRRAPECVGTPATAAEALQVGSSLLCAGYCVYGGSTQLVMAFAGDVVNVFTLDPSIGEFIMSAPALRIPTAPQRIYSINEGNMASFPRFVQRFVAECKSGAKPYSLRYTGSMVADVHRTILYGGVFLYPATTAAPEGKLRLLYECHPMAMLLELAGGAAVTGVAQGPQRILDLLPSGPHARSPILLGCTRDVNRLLALQAEDAAAGGV